MEFQLALHTAWVVAKVVVSRDIANMACFFAAGTRFAYMIEQLTAAKSCLTLISTAVIWLRPFELCMARAPISTQASPKRVRGSFPDRPVQCTEAAPQAPCGVVLSLHDSWT